ncbi:hypothetical protein F4775DRAFT_596608 [Biscogniauxia sp. FL1348]|nr:hypothetical protein F4775DRAFT_596608 [Biscogniauxia sp. FL1348]
MPWPFLLVLVLDDAGQGQFYLIAKSMLANEALCALVNALISIRSLCVKCVGVVLLVLSTGGLTPRKIDPGTRRDSMPPKVTRTEAIPGVGGRNSSSEAHTRRVWLRVL